MLTQRGGLYMCTFLGMDESGELSLRTLESTERLPHQRAPPPRECWNSPTTAKGISKTPTQLLRKSLQSQQSGVERALESLAPQVIDPTRDLEPCLGGAARISAILTPF